MYVRGVHAETSIPVLQQLIRSNPLGILTTAIRSKEFPTIQSSHIPWVLDLGAEGGENELGVLRGHLARVNPQSKAMIQELQNRLGSNEAGYLEEEVLVLFTTPVQHYVTPKFYTETKPYSGKVVPTWNYAAAQAYGRIRVFHDAKSSESGAFLSKQIRDLSQHAETNVMGFDGTDGKPDAWEVADAPEKFINLLQNAIIGVEIKIDRLEGKFKMSQEMSLGDRNGVVNGFSKLDSDVAGNVAQLVKERSDLKEQSKIAAH